MEKYIAPKFKAFISSKPMVLFLSLFKWPRLIIRKGYDWVVKWAQTAYAEYALVGVSFAESSFFPIPPDPLLMAMVFTKPKRWLKFASITLVASVLGGMFGYLIGWSLFQSIGEWLINTYHLQEEYTRLGQSYQNNAFLAVFAAALTPIPYKIITITAGAFRINFAAFILASILGRGARFFAVSALARFLGERYKDKIEKYIDIISLALLALIVFAVVLIS